MSTVNLSIETLKSVNYGDHGERIRTSHVQVDGETIEDLVTRLFSELSSEWQQHDPTNEIVIRVMVEADGKVSGQAVRDPNATPF